MASLTECEIKVMNKVREVAGVTKGVKKAGETVLGYTVAKVITWRSPFAVIKELTANGCKVPSEEEVVAALKKAGYLK
jgi:hypothetical protein